MSSLLRFARRSLRAKIIAWFFVPTAIILVGVALVNFYAYQEVTEDLVIERDQDLIRLSAGQVTDILAEFTNVLVDVGKTADLSPTNPTSPQSALQNARSQLAVFDGGALILDRRGTVVAVEPMWPGVLGQDWSDRPYYGEMLRSHIVGSPGTVFSEIAADGFQGEEVVVVVVPITGEQDEFLGSTIGMFRLSTASTSAFYGGIVKLRLEKGGAVYLVDGGGRVIYHSNSNHIGADFSMQPVVGRLLERQGGAIRTEDLEGSDIVAGFAPILGTDWGLVREESWAALTSEGRNFQRFLMLLLALGVAVPAVFVAVGIRQIMRPVDDLIGAAREVARGKFGQAIAVRSNDEIGELAREFNLMSDQLRESYETLEQRVVERTRELGESEERLRTVVTGAPVVLFALDKDGIFTLSEGRGLDALGLKPGEIVGQSVFDVYRDVPQIIEHIRDALDGKEVAVTAEVAGLTFESRYTPIKRASGEVFGVIGVATDVTEQIRAEHAMREAQERYRSIFENAIVGIYQTTPEGRHITANPGLARIFGYDSPEEMINERTDIGMQVYVEPGRREEYVRIIEENGAVTGFESQAYRKDGSVVWVAETGRAVRNEKGETVYYEGTLQDISEHKKAEEALFQQTRELAVLEERNRMAKEIHDTLAQGFTGIVLQLEAAEQALEESPSEVPGHLASAKTLGRASLQEARRSVWGLLPQALEDRSLDVALNDEVNRFTAISQTSATFNLAGTKKELQAEVQAAILRICQESLTNIGRHAQAAHVAVSLLFTPETVYLRIRDDGVGFDVEAVRAKGRESGFGLVGMDGRVRQLGGSLTISSKNGEGSLIEAAIPVLM